MATDKLLQNIDEFRTTIRNWPTSAIEKNVLIEMLDDLYERNPQLSVLHGALSPPTRDYLSGHNHARFGVIEDSPNRSTIEQTSTTNGTHLIKNEFIPLPTPSAGIIVAIEGALTVQKGSTILTPLIKRQGLKTEVYCELSYVYYGNDKPIYLTVYQNRKSRKIIHKFDLDFTCSIFAESKKQFRLEHKSGIETFTTDGSLADGWVSSFHQISIRHDGDEIYETLGDSFENDTPTRPPPRPARFDNLLSPENIYVCLYDHDSTTDDRYELEFHCGDLLYITNTDGANFYFGHRLILPWNSQQETLSLGFVFKDYIRPAYEKV